MQPDKVTVVSVVAPMQNAAEYVEAFVRETSAVLNAQYQYWEIILVDDASTDGTSAMMPELLTKFERVRYLRLSRSFGTEAATAAGLDSAVGDYVVVMDPNTDPPEMIPELIVATQKTGGIMNGIANPGRQNAIARWGARLFRTYCRRYLGIRLRAHSTHFYVISRQVVNAIAQFKDSRRFLRIFTTLVGYDLQYFDYQRIHRGGSARPLSTLAKVEMGVDIVVAHSRHPLRLVSRLGLLVSLLNALYIGYIGIVYLVKRHVAEGWTTTSLQNTVMFFFLFLILTVLCEYLGRLFEEVQQKPLYLIAAEKNSSVLLEHHIKRNIVDASI